MRDHLPVEVLPICGFEIVRYVIAIWKTVRRIRHVLAHHGNIQQESAPLPLHFHAVQKRMPVFADHHENKAFAHQVSIYLYIY